jgi:hypothetical protein
MLSPLKRFPFARLLVSIFAFTCLSVLAQTNCPDCYYNQLPFDTNHLAAEDGSGRRTITVRIETQGEHSWGEQTNSRIWNGASEAIRDWNTATDGYGHTTGYYFKLDQAATNADFIIKRVQTATGCSEIEGSSPPYVLKLPPNTAISFTDAEIAGRFPRC